MIRFYLQKTSPKNFMFAKTTRHDKMVALRNVSFDHLLQFYFNTQIAKIHRSTIKDYGYFRFLLKVLQSILTSIFGQKGQNM